MKKSQKPRKKASHSELSAINPNAAGIDIGAERHWVSVPEGRDDENVRSFSLRLLVLTLFPILPLANVFLKKSISEESRTNEELLEFWDYLKSKNEQSHDDG